jgi:hypothetical protein
METDHEYLNMYVLMEEMKGYHVGKLRNETEYSIIT